MPSKPARYGIKIWVACDAQSSYAWKMQVYAGKPDKLGPPEKNLAARVVMDLTEGLAPGRNVTCDNFFTSRELATRLFHERGHTLLGTLRANRPEIPRELRCVKGRAVGSTQAAVLRGDPDGWSPNAVVLSYVAKKNKNVLLLTTSPRYVGPSGSLLEPSSNPDGGGGGSVKPSMVLHYNRTKGGVDNLDKVVGTYSCRRKTSRWPVALFHNMVDVAAYNAFVLWREIHPDWMSGKLNKRRLFLERLGKALVLPTLEARRRRGTRGGRREGEGEGEAVSTPDSRRDEPRETPVKRQEQGRQDQDRLLRLPRACVLEVRAHVLPQLHRGPLSGFATRPLRRRRAPGPTGVCLTPLPFSLSLSTSEDGREKLPIDTPTTRRPSASASTTRDIHELLLQSSRHWEWTRTVVTAATTARTATRGSRSLNRTESDRLESANRGRSDRRGNRTSVPVCFRDHPPVATGTNTKETHRFKPWLRSTGRARVPFAESRKPGALQTPPQKQRETSSDTMRGFSIRRNRAAAVAIDGGLQPFRCLCLMLRRDPL
uniref:PiggyBac transposable element-derived protein domain-containing protein n=1 Tax=Oreochromis niloticus TaxID=8128 RepID=A0A669CW59_ORENI